MELTSLDFNYLGLCLEAFFFGIYSATFIMYIHYHVSKRQCDKGKSILFFAICSLYILSIVTIILDLAGVGIFLNLGPNPSLAMIRMMYNTEIIGFIVVGCCDFIAQSILIYRCWIVWGHNIQVVILPIILVFAFLATWVASIAPLSIVQSQIVLEPPWSHTLLLFSLTASMTVNTLVTALIVFKIFKVFRGAKIQIISGGETLGSTGGSKLRSIIFILIESGSALFCIQLVRLTVTILATNTSVQAFDLIVGIHQMLNGLTPTIILVRVSMGLSFHDEKSMADVTTMHLHPPEETESTVIIIGQRTIGYQDDTFHDSIEKSEKSVDGSLL